MDKDKLKEMEERFHMEFNPMPIQGVAVNVWYSKLLSFLRREIINAYERGYNDALEFRRDNI
jgi:hypothetical protein